MPDKKISRIEQAIESLAPHEAACSLCPRDCRVDRRKSPSGICKSGVRAGVSSGLLHFGEEPVLSGASGKSVDGSGPGRGSGTIFFTGCNLKCVFCQNFQISWEGRGQTLTDEKLAELMLDLQARGAFNINLVSPTHIIVPILRALRIAVPRGLKIPIVYNSNGYEKIDVLEHLAGIIDVYLPDLKYHAASISKRYSGAPDYFAHASVAVQEMFVQQPDLDLGEDDIARKGLIIRHLVLPGLIEDSMSILDWIARTLPPGTAVSLMSQFLPCYKTPDELRRPLAPEEYRTVVDGAHGLGLSNLFIQPELFRPGEHLVPDFERPEPFLWRPGK
jgi:putative pyruvate formate lyase activating enzyme